MKGFFRYLLSKRATLLACLFFALLFIASFSLYRLPLQAVLYPTALCLIFGCAFLIIDYLRIKKIADELRRISRMRSETIGTLPKTSTLQDYIRLNKWISFFEFSNKLLSFKSL